MPVGAGERRAMYDFPLNLMPFQYLAMEQLMIEHCMSVCNALVLRKSNFTFRGHPIIPKITWFEYLGIFLMVPEILYILQSQTLTLRKPITWSRPKSFTFAPSNQIYYFRSEDVQDMKICKHFTYVMDRQSYNFIHICRLLCT